MDCKYINQNDVHELYLLDRLEGNKKKEYLDHIKTCKTCYAQFEQQRLLISSVRSFGKREMKDEISRQVKELKSKPPSINWDMILKIAAVFFFLVITPGLIYYYQTIEPPDLNVNESTMDKKLEISEKNLPVSIEPAERIKTEKDKSSLPKKRIELSEPAADVLSGAGSATIDARIKVISRQKNIKKKNRQAIGKNAKEESENNIPEMMSLPKLENNNFFSALKFYEPVAVISDKSVVKKLGQPNERSKDLSGMTNAMQLQKIKVAEPNKVESFNNKKATQLDEYTLIYKLDNKNIICTIKKYNLELDLDADTSLPVSFPVKMQNADSLDIKMIWYVNSAFLLINPNEIGINMDIDNLIFIQTPLNQIYKVEKNTDSTQAILVK